MIRRSRPILTAALALAFLLAACSSGPTPSPRDVEPTPSAELTTGASASPSAEPAESVSGDASPSASFDTGDQFTVMPNPAADALFLSRNSCQNLENGYQLEFPAEWNTNAEFGAIPPCSWFSPTEYSVDDPDEAPPEVAITIEYVEGDTGFLEEVVSRETVIVGATQEAVRVEVQGAEGEGGTMPSDWRSYVYQVQLGPTPEEGPNLVVQTTTEMGGDYELNKAVLDRMMATIEFIGTVQ